MNWLFIFRRKTIASLKLASFDRTKTRSYFFFRKVGRQELSENREDWRQFANRVLKIHFIG